MIAALTRLGQPTTRTLNSHAVRARPTDPERAAPQPASDPGRRGFRRLLAVRLISQLGDGWFQAGLASSVLFNPEQAASPVAIAVGLRRAAAAVLDARPVRRRVPRPVEPAHHAVRGQRDPGRAGAAGRVAGLVRHGRTCSSSSPRWASSRSTGSSWPACRPPSRTWSRRPAGHGELVRHHARHDLLHGRPGQRRRHLPPGRHRRSSVRDRRRPARSSGTGWPPLLTRGRFRPDALGPDDGDRPSDARSARLARHRARAWSPACATSRARRPPGRVLLRPGRPPRAVRRAGARRAAAVPQLLQRRRRQPPRSPAWCRWPPARRSARWPRRSSPRRLTRRIGGWRWVTVVIAVAGRAGTGARAAVLGRCSRRPRRSW